MHPSLTWGAAGAACSLLLPCNEVAWEEPLPRGSSFWRELGAGGSLLLPCNEVAWEEPLPRLSSFWRGLGVGGSPRSRNFPENQNSPVTRTVPDYQKGLGVLLYRRKIAALDTNTFHFFMGSLNYIIAT